MIENISPPPPVLTITGSYPSGGAGIQVSVDLKTFAALKCYGMGVITSLTSQNTCGVSKVLRIKPEFVRSQIMDVLSDIPACASIAKTVADTLKHRYSEGNGQIDANIKAFPAISIDPVCVSTSGHTFLHRTALRVLVEDWFPIASLLTPNKAEAELVVDASEAMNVARQEEGDFDSAI